MRKPSPYRIFRAAPGHAALVLQVRDPETAEAVSPGDLEAYKVRVSIRTPWRGLETLRSGSKMLLTPSAARFMLAAGTIEALEEPRLIFSRESRSEGGNPTLGGDQERPARPPAV